MNRNVTLVRFPDNGVFTPYGGPVKEAQSLNGQREIADLGALG